MNTYKIRQIFPEEYASWNTLVAKSPQGSIFHTIDWITTSARLAGHTPMIFGCYSEKDLLGGCAMYRHEGYRIFSYGSSVTPMTPYGGFCLLPSTSSKGKKRFVHNQNFLTSLGDHIARSFDAVSIINAPEYRDIRPLQWNGWASSVNYTYVLPLQQEGRPESRNVKTAARRAERHGINVKKEHDVNIYWSLFQKTFTKQGIPPIATESYLKGIIGMLNTTGQGEMWIARTSDGIPASAMYVIWDAKKVHAWSAASDPALLGTGANTLLVSQLLQDLKYRGFGVMNLMTANMPQLTAFYTSFSPQLVPYFQVSWANLKGHVALWSWNTLGSLRTLTASRK